MANGSIQEVSINNRLFSVAADADSNRKLGGFEVEVQANGDGTVRKKLTRVPFKIDGLQLSVLDVRGDQEFLQDVANQPGLVPVTITYVGGTTYQGVGTVTGELQYSSQNGTCTVTLEGQAELTLQ